MTKRASAKENRKRYPIEFKLRIVRQVREHGGGAEIARQHGIPPQTLSNWLAAESEGKLRPPLKLDAREIGYLVNLLSADAKDKAFSGIAHGILGKLQHLAAASQDIALDVSSKPASKRARAPVDASDGKRRAAGASSAESVRTEEEAAILAEMRKLNPEFRKEVERSVQALFRLQLRDMTIQQRRLYSN